MKRLIPVLSLTLLLASAGPGFAYPVNSDTFSQQRHLIELGIYGGAFFADNDHALYERGVGIAHKRINDAAFHIGGRFSYLPIPYVGVEVEGGVMPTAANGQDILLYTIRGHIIGQYPARFSPFAVLGGGALGVSSDNNALGSNTDFDIYFGLGAKFYATHWLALRVDGRYNLTVQRKSGFVGHFEALAGVSFVLGWKPVDSDGDGLTDDKDKCPKVAAKTKNGCPPVDSDGDGLTDDKDKCPKVAAQTKDGCPIPDTDGDGVTDDKDKCPKVPAKTEDGCPPPIGDTDGDGIKDDKDKCPKVPAQTPDGCPLPDRDKDGIPDADDKCPDKPETKNGYEDSDGCPDALPKKVKRFTGAIKGIYFANNKATIRRVSFGKLNRAVKVLKEFKSLKVIIRGHTDAKGSDAYNVDLSQRRAQAVRTYMVSKGIDESRLEAAGVGKGEPIADNKTARGRAKNRRIEFKLK
jgi:outer membrane protein OmpA-like peptidoglycan-associated protein